MFKNIFLVVIFAVLTSFSNHKEIKNPFDVIQDESGQVLAINKAQRLKATFTSKGAHIQSTRSQKAWELDLHLTHFGRPNALETVGPGALTFCKNRVELDRPYIKEWFVNDKRGLEQGFTIAKAPEGEGAQLALELCVDEDWRIFVSEDKRNLTFANRRGQLVDYSGLIAEDARGKALKTWFDLKNEKSNSCLILVDIAEAQFPIVVDPVITEAEKILPQDPDIDDQFGFSVDISGDIAIVGSIGDDDNGTFSGSAYIFVRSGLDWVQQAKLLPSDGLAGEFFGSSVAVSGETVIVGMPADTDNGLGSGSAYIFVRNGTTWTQQAKLLPQDGAPGDGFGTSVDISGDTIIASSPVDSDNGSLSGSAYIFVRNGTTWTQQAKLLPDDGEALDRFAESASISGETVAVGAIGDDDNGSDSGSAYIFVRSGTAWTQQAKLLPQDGAAGDTFGESVSISGEDVVVGSVFDDDNGTQSGSAYVFVRSGTTWTQQAKLLPNDGAVLDFFGQSVSISNETVVVGAPFDDDSGLNSGSAYVFVRTGIVWTERVKLLAIDGASGDSFARSVGLSNEVCILGARFDDDNGEDSGSAYVINVFCQKDLGFQLGDLKLGMCGSDLTQDGSNALLCLTGASPNAQVFFALGFNHNPMPFLGGFIVPFPFTMVGPLITDSAGVFSLPLSGGSTAPVTIFLQAVELNGASSKISNALEINVGG